MNEDETPVKSDGALCRECGSEIDTERSKWSAEELVVCTDCWFEELTGDYCEGCEREVGIKPPLRRCESCGNEYPEERMEALDVSEPDEYYPEFIYLCGGCSDGE